MFDTENFIAEVRKRPVIYDINHYQYNDKSVKMNAWHEVGQAVLPEWDHMTPEEQSSEDKLLRNKWRNIRDYFIKEYKLQSTMKQGLNKKKRKRYAYYHHLLFLMPIVQAKHYEQSKHRNSTTEVQIKIEESDIDEDTMNLGEYNVATSSSTDVKDYLYIQNGPVASKKPRQADPFCETSMTPTLCENNEATDVQSTNGGSQKVSVFDDNDYDKMFLLSLLPSFRQIPESMNLQVRIQIQQILASALSSKNDDSQTTN